MLYSLKVHSKTNAGDKHCNPLDYFDVFSTCFLGLPHVNLYANQPSSYTPVKGQFLDECRQLNRRAYDDVKTLLDQRLIDVL